jgi:hypothetical protein
MLLHTSSLRWCYLFLGLLLISCHPITPLAMTQGAISETQTTSPPALPMASSTPKSPFTAVPTLLTTEAATQTTLTTSTNPKIDLDLRVSYITYEYDNKNEILTSQFWVLYPPYQSPQLLYRTGDGNQDHIISSVFWSHNNRLAAFAHLAGDQSHIAFSVFDTITQEVYPLSETFSIDRPFQTQFDVEWSFDDRWLYLEYEDIEQFIHAQIVNIETKETYPLDHSTQDVLTAWSPIVADEFAYISRKDFPNPGGDVICVGKVSQNTPLRCTEKFSVLIGGNTFSWSSDGEKALAVAGNNTKTFRYLLLDLNTMQWKLFLTLSETWLNLSENWSPDNQFIVFYNYNQGLHLLNVSDENPKLIRVSDLESAHPLGWLSDSQVLIFQADYSVYAVNPKDLHNVELVEDFTALLKTKTPIYQIDLMKD